MLTKTGVSEPLVTVCISTYNRANMIEEAVKRVLGQSYTCLELIVVNDGSTDATRLVLDGISALDTRIKVIHNAKNLGLSASRNKAIQSARGLWFTFIDDDDLWVDNFLEVMLKEATLRSVDCVIAGFIRKGFTYVYLPGVRTLKEMILEGYTPPVGCQFYSIESIRSVGGYNEDVRSGVDHDLWIRLGCLSGVRVALLADPLVVPDGVVENGRIKMTKDPTSRISGISNALLHWRRDLVLIAGEEFYDFFKEEYTFYLKSRFFNLFLKCLDVSILRAFLSEKLTRRGWSKFFWRYLQSLMMSRFGRSQKDECGNYLIKPLFRPFRSGKG